MKITEIRKHAKELHRLVALGQIITAIEMLRDVAREGQCGVVIEGLEDVAFKYKKMLDYYVGGADDPQRKQIYRALVDQLHDLIDRWVDVADSKQSWPTLALQTQRLVVQTEQRRINEGIDEGFLFHERRYRQLVRDFTDGLFAGKEGEYYQQSEAAAYEMFAFAWTSPYYEEFLPVLSAFITDSSLPIVHREMLIGGVLLAFSSRYHEPYVRMLMGFCLSDEVKIRARAMVALLLVLMTYTDRCGSLLAEVDTLLSNGDLRKIFFETLLVMERTRALDTIEKKVTEEIMPELAKAKHDFDKVSPDDASFEEYLFDRPKLISGLDKIAEWKSDGVDILISSIRYMKGHPFFSQVHRWFLPFHVNQPLLRVCFDSSSMQGLEKLCQKFADTHGLCDSDKYSTLFSIYDLRKQDAIARFNLNLEAIDEALFDEEKDHQPVRECLMITGQFVQDVYRFYFLHPRRNDFINVFDGLADFHRTAVFQRLFSDPAYEEQLGEILAKYELYTDAALIFEKQLEADSTNTDAAQKAAYCHFRTNNTQRALDLFLQVDLTTDNRWVKRKIAQCYVRLEKPKMAIFYLEQLKNADPTNTTFTTALADCLFDTGDFDRALNYYFEVEYAEPDNEEMLHKIVQCAFFCTRIDVASRHIERLDVTTLSPRELMIAGHIRLCQGRRKEAVELYRNCLQKGKGSINFIEQMRTDEPYLAKNNVDTSDLPLVADAVLR